MFFFIRKPLELLKTSWQERRRCEGLVKSALQKADSSVQLQEWKRLDTSYVIAYATTSVYRLRFIRRITTHWFYVINLRSASVAEQWDVQPFEFFNFTVTADGVIRIHVVHAASFTGIPSKLIFDPQQSCLAPTA